LGNAESVADDVGITKARLIQKSEKSYVLEGIHLPLKWLLPSAKKIADVCFELFLDWPQTRFFQMDSPPARIYTCLAAAISTNFQKPLVCYFRAGFRIDPDGYRPDGLRSFICRHPWIDFHFNAIPCSGYQ
jgi:hypothetical protein